MNETYAGICSTLGTEWNKPEVLSPIVNTAIPKYFSFRMRFGGQAVGALGQELIKQAVTNSGAELYCEDISKKLERLKPSREEDIIISEDINDIINFSVSNLRNYDNSLISSMISTKGAHTYAPQLTTNYDIRDFLDKLCHDKISKGLKTFDLSQDEVNKLINNKEFKKSMSNMNTMFILFDPKTLSDFGIFYFDIDSFMKDTVAIQYKFNTAHSTFYFIRDDGKALATIPYAKNDGNAFLRGIWANLRWAKNYFIPIIDWTPFKAIDFTYDFFAD